MIASNAVYDLGPRMLPVSARTDPQGRKRRRFAGQWTGTLPSRQLKNKPATLALLAGGPTSRVQEFLVSISRRDSRALPCAPNPEQSSGRCSAEVVT